MALRELTSHKDAGLNEKIGVFTLDEPGAGGAYHEYLIKVGAVPALHISFQNGPVREAGLNGISGEALLAVVEDRLAAFQAGPFACKENADALEHVQAALQRMHDRTSARTKRGVEGTNTK